MNISDYIKSISYNEIGAIRNEIPTKLDKKSIFKYIKNFFYIK